jgi:short-subunit dehydrogenase
MELTGRSVLLTGATGGIGHAIARTLHARGAKLVLTGRRAEVLEPLADEVGGRALPIDLSKAKDVTKLIDECQDVDIFVANAALAASGAPTEMTTAQIDSALAVNLRAPIVMAGALGARMATRGSGHIVLISSLAGIAGSPRSGLYSATKFGLRGFGQGLRCDLHPRGVGVSVVFPGFVSDAGMFAGAGVKLPSYVGTSTPEQVADGVVRAIERDRGEVLVAPVGMRVGTTVASIFPELAARLQRRLGGDDIADSMASGQAGWS